MALKLRKLLHWACLVPLLATGITHAQQAAAPAFPTQPIKIIVPFPAGGGNDATARILGEKMRARLGQMVVVDNRTGAGGNVGAAYVASSAPDGYTLLATAAGPLTVNSILYKKLGFNPSAFEPIAMLAYSPMVLAVRKDLPAKTIREFIAYAKAHPNKVTFASQGNATTSHLSLELFKQMTGTNASHVAYRGTAPAAADLMGGHVDALFAEIATLIPLHNAGLIRILASATDKRLAALPNIPTLQEQGMSGFRAAAWFGLVAPAKTPQPVLKALNDAVNEVLRAQDVRDSLAKIHVQTMGGTPEELAAYLKEETKRWGDVIRVANIRLD
jgi:tripartite-type tricarboxylate transporter receptor subunit TctC